MSYPTAPREYFNAVIEAMRRHGFELLAWVTMNSERYTYHISSVRYAQESRLFFVAPRKAFIVMLELTELFGRKTWTSGSDAWDEGYRQVYWSGSVDYAYSMRRWYEAEAERRFATSNLSEESRSLDKLVSDCLNDSVFHWISGAFEQTDAVSSTTLVEPEKLARPFGEMLKLLAPYLYPHFKRLQVTNYAPHYTFPGQERDFWKKFPLQRLRVIAPNIWGSAFS